MVKQSCLLLLATLRNVIRIQLFYFFQELIKPMGQQMCSMGSQDLSQTLRQLAFDQGQIPTDDCNDIQIPSDQRFNFLKTQVVASWNILQQTTRQNVSPNFTTIRPTKARSTKTKHENEDIQADENECQQQLNALKESSLKLGENLIAKKYLDVFRHKAYQNLQIDMSSFIKIKHQNVNDYYDFYQKIGEGTFGSVFRCIEKRTGEVRAVKALKKKAMNSISKMSFAAQIDLLKKLDHPNIVKLYDLFLYKGNYYLITQFCEGGCLEKYLLQHKDPLPEQTIKCIIKQLVSVINYLCSTSVVHRDLKLENVVFLNKITEGSKDFEIRLIDFGTAVKVQKHRKYESGLVGTLLYLAPQFAKGFYTDKCDIWSAGIMLYRLIFKDFPFKGRTQKEILNQIMTKQIDWNKLGPKMAHISELGRQFLKMMLDKNYLSRASSKTLVQHQWIIRGQTQMITLEMKNSAATSLAQYNRKNNFVSVIESFLSFKKVTKQERHELAQMFFQIDKDQSGLIEAQEMIYFLRKKYPEFDEVKIKQIVQNVDKNNSGKIDFNQFIVAMGKKSELFAEEALKEAFEYVDQDKTGFLSKKELKKLLKQAEKRQIEEVFENVDSDGDNKISFEEFRIYLLRM